MYRVAEGSGICEYNFCVEKKTKIGNWSYVNNSICKTREEAEEFMKEMEAK